MLKRGLFINFEGIDGSGTSSHTHLLEKRIEALNKYQDVIRTHEPWNSVELKDRLEKDREIYTNPLTMAELFIEDRARHTQKLIRPNIEAGVVVLNSRYKMSTCAYQWAQGAQIHELLKRHEHFGLLNPDLTFFLDVPISVARKRITTSRRKRELFERDVVFVNKLVNAYNSLVHISEVDPSVFGRVIRINGNRNIDDVSSDIFKEFLKTYKK